mgnify:CR=1 FL=1
MKKINHWINGKNVAGAEYFHTTNPATGEVLAEVASGGEAEVNQAVAAAKEAFPKWANLPMKERARLMRRLGDLIDQNVPEIAAMETADTGLPIHQTKNVLIPRASHNFEFFAEVCQQMNGKTYPVDDKMLNYTLVQPVGVCALVSPWNVPFMTATWKVAPCLALGNTAVLKMSELSPLTADRLGELALEAGIPAGVLNVVQGYGASAGDALVRHHDVRAVSFTGGTATGRNIMKNAGLKKYSMELGGKSPAKQLEHVLHPWVAYLILPLFAFANAGVSLQGVTIEGLTSLLPLGIIAGLFIGKPLGISLFCWLALKLKWASLPEGTTCKQIVAVGILCGIGFTMSIFIASLAFSSVNPGLINWAKLGILIGSVLSAVTGYMILRRRIADTTTA